MGSGYYDYYSDFVDNGIDGSTTSTQSEQQVLSLTDPFYFAPVLHIIASHSWNVGPLPNGRSYTNNGREELNITKKLHRARILPSSSEQRLGNWDKAIERE